MALSLTPIYFANNDTPITLITLANAIVNAIATEVVSVNTSSNGALTTGNGYISGIFGASVLVGGQIQGGSVNASSNLNLTSNLVGNSSQTITLGNTTVNATINSTSVNVASIQANSAIINYFSLGLLNVANGVSNTQIAALSYTSTGASSQVMDYWGLTVFRSAEYMISVTDNNANSYQLSKLLVVQNGGGAYATEYGVITSNATVSAFTVSVNATSLLLNCAPVSTNATFQITRTAVRI